MGSHINADGKFQSDKYPTTPPDCVPLKVTDKTAQDLLWEYARRRRSVDAEFSGDLESRLRDVGYALSGCTGTEASWCPIHGDCRCPRLRDNPDNVRTLDDASCLLHAPTSKHGEEPTDAPSPGEAGEGVPWTERAMREWRWLTGQKQEAIVATEAKRAEPYVAKASDWRWIDLGEGRGAFLCLPTEQFVSDEEGRHVLTPESVPSGLRHLYEKHRTQESK